MSNETKKALLNEATTKRFWKLAGLRPIHEKAFMFEKEEDLEEMNRAKEDEDEVKEEGMDRAKEDEEDVKKEGMDRAKEDDKEEGLGHGGKKFPAKTKKKDIPHAGQPQRNLKEEDIDEMGMGMPAAAEDDMGGEEPGMEDEGPEDGQDVEVDVPEGDVASLKTARDILDQILSAVDGGEEPEMDAEPEMGDDEEEPALQEVDQEELEEVAERIASRVAKRISESLIRNKN